MEFVYEFEEKSHIYEPEDNQIENALIEIICNNYGKNDGEALKMATYIVKSLDVSDALIEQFQEELKEYFEELAMIDFERCKVEAEELDSWYGTRRNIVGV